MRGRMGVARSFGLALFGTVVLAGMALVGIAWLAAALYLVMEPALGRVGACAITGAALFLPVAALGVWMFAAGARGAGAEEAFLEGLASLVPQLSRTIDEIVRKNPLGTVALFMGLGMVAARDPSILTALVRALLRASDDGKSAT